MFIDAPLLLVDAVDDPTAKLPSMRPFGQQTRGGCQHLEIAGGHFAALAAPAALVELLLTAGELVSS